MAAKCATCGASRNHSTHLRAVAGANYHPYSDPSRAGIQPLSAGRRAHLASEQHQEAYAAADRDDTCMAASVGCTEPCAGPLTKHHTWPKGVAGGAKNSEANAPVVLLCAHHNTWVQEAGRDWATSHYFTRGNRQYPFLIDEQWLRAERERQL